MLDINELQQAKAQCLDDLTKALPSYVNTLMNIDPRLLAYVEDAISNNGSHANLRYSRKRGGRCVDSGH